MQVEKADMRTLRDFRGHTVVPYKVLLVENAFVPVASEAPPPQSCELGVAPVANWHSRQPGIMHQLMRQPPTSLAVDSGL